MKNTIYFFIFILTLFLSSINTNAQFVATNGPGNGAGHIYTLVEAGNKLYAATENNGIVVTTNDGDTWTQVNSGLPDLHMQCMAAAGIYLYAGTRSYGLYRSSNEGANWYPIQPKFQNCSVTALAYTNNTLYMYSYYPGAPWYDDLWESADFGNNWRANSFSADSMRVFSIAYINNYLFLGTESNGIYRSSDNGFSWNAVNNGIRANPGPSVAIKEFNNKIYAGTWGGAYTSTNNGDNWIYFQSQGTGLRANDFISISGFVLDASAGGIYYTYDNGITWHVPDYTFLYSTFLFSLAKDSNYVYTGDLYGTVYRRPISEFVIGLQNSGTVIPGSFSLSQNYPNPFNPSTTIGFALPNASHVVLKIYDQLGQEAAKLIDQQLNAGTYSFDFNAGNLASGIYFYKLTAGDFSSTKKMVLIK